jgi:hypothetical protein
MAKELGTSAINKLPAEITNAIIDFLHDSPGSLKCCSLVGRSCVSRSRYHLFYEICLRGEGFSWDHVACDDNLAAPFTRFPYSSDCPKTASHLLE